MSKQTDVLIIGGGMAGLSMAIALAKLGLDVTLVEKTPFQTQHLPAFDGRVSAIAQGSKRMLDRLGVWAAMEPHAEPIWDIRVSDGNSPFVLHYDHQEVGTDAFGWIVENRHTRKALCGVAREFDNLQIVQASIASLQQSEDGCEVELDDGSVYHAKLLIGADSKFSKTRELAGIAVHETKYKQTAIVCTIKHEKPHHGLAQERFLPRGPFAVLPMQANRSSLVWVEPAKFAGDYARLNPQDLVAEITQRVGDYLGNLEVEGDVFTYPLSLSLSESFTAGRTALIGDAAHAIHPIAGQGINLGFRDVAVLAELIEAQQVAGLDIAAPSVMAAYAKWRRSDTIAMAMATDGLNRLFSNKILPLSLARGLGLFAVSKLPSLKRQFMRHAMGVSGDLPVLMLP